jgi:Kef-type K+ transport system membrane component KefB
MSMLELAAVGPGTVHLNALILVGLAITLGSLGAKTFKHLHIPQVIGYIVVGIIVGRSGLHLIDESVLVTLEPFNFIALGFVGFQIGGELKATTFRKHGKQFAAILLAEAVGAFLLVAALVFAAGLLCKADPRQAAALALVLGAIASATAPAATMNVLRECRARGILTTTILAIVALDDAVAVSLFAVASSLAGALVGNGVHLSEAFLEPVRELGLAVCLGGATGSGLAVYVRKVAAKDTALVISVATVVLGIGASFVIGADPIMAAMFLGFTFVNLAPGPARDAFQLVERFAAPIFVLFFVMAGSRLKIANLQGWMWMAAGAYVAGRMAGKMAGASLGATLSGSAKVLRRYLGPCLFSQAGVAVGLSILARMRLGEGLGEVVIAVVATTVFLFEIVGPITARLGVLRAGEAWRNVTEEDLSRSYRVADVMDSKPPSFHEHAPLSEVLRSFGQHDVDAFSVIGDDGDLRGVVTLEEIRESLAAEGLGQWLLATDLAGPAPFETDPGMPLYEALEKMRRDRIESVPVVSHEGGGRLVGMIRQRAVRRAIMTELHRRHVGEERPEAVLAGSGGP